MLNIALYGHNEKFLNEFEERLTLALHSFGHEFLKLQRVAFYQTSLFDNYVDLFIIDLSMEPEKGFQFAKDARELSHGEIIFVGTESKYAMDAYDLDALGYYLFPVDVKRITRKILRRFSQSIDRYDSLQVFKTANGLSIIPAKHIVYIEYSSHKMNIHLDTDRVIQTTTMRQSFSDATESLLEYDCFVRTHASFIINLSHISSLKSSAVTLDTGATVPISNAKYPSVKQQLLTFFGKNTSKI